MILLIDNYDSFTFNIYNMLADKVEIKVLRNDKFNVEDLDDMKIDGIIISPGPGSPKDAGLSGKVVEKFRGKIPILGVCLGHQVIVERFGGKVIHAENIFHGRRSIINLTKEGEVSPIFKGISKTFLGGRYHSLIADNTSMVKELKVAALTKSGEIMAVVNDHLKIYGLQFHPESVLTPEGDKILDNFVEICMGGKGNVSSIA